MPDTPSHRVAPEADRIPLVTHIITDDDIGILQGSALEPLNLNRIVKLLTDPHSVSLVDRHISALKKIVKHYDKGFPMKDLVQVFKILNVCADRVENLPLYEQQIIDILKICSLPYLKEKSSDELVYEQIIIESVSQLGYLMRVPSTAIRQQICQTLVSFYCDTPPMQHVLKHKASTVEFNKKIIEASDISETLVKSLALIENDRDVRLAVLTTLLHFSQNSAKNCDQMLLAEGARIICSHLTDPDSSGQTLFHSVEILWNLLENGDKAQLAHQLNNLLCISQLQDAFIFQLVQGYSHYDRQLRNDILVIATLVAYTCQLAPFLETGFVRQLTLFATFQEVKSHSVLVKHLKLHTNHEDFELKKLLINVLMVLSKDPCVLPILSEGHLLLALFSYVRPNDKHFGPREWTIAQFEELQLHAMSCLSTLCPLMLDDYMTCQGSTRLLMLLEWCVGPDTFQGHGNSFHGAGGRGNKLAQMRHCLRLMRSIVSTQDEVVLQDLADQGAINQLIGILNTAFPTPLETENAVGIEMQSDVLFILSCICEHDLHRKELFGTAGVDILAHYLKFNPKLLNSGLGHHCLLLSAIDCLWCTIVGCFSNEDYFLEKEGVFLLMDLLEVCPRNMHNLILGCLLDFCENPKTMTHLMTWRSSTNTSAARMFCQIWRQEEAFIGAKRDKHGAITDIQAPLMGRMHQEADIIPLPAKFPSQAIVDISENMRAKIHSLFCKMGFTDLPGLEVEDHVTLTVIEKFLDFKMGEVWTEIIKELEIENVLPVIQDQEAIEAITRAIKERVHIVSSTQTGLLEAQMTQDIIDEQEYYAEIRENYRQKEKELNDFYEYVARTSNYSLLKAAKQRQEISIDASRMQLKFADGQTFHNVEIPKLNITTFSGRYVAVASTPVKPKNVTLKTVHPSNTAPVPSHHPLVKHLTM